MRRSGIAIMKGLMELVWPLAHIMLVTIVFGVLGYIAAILVTVLGVALLLSLVPGSTLGLDVQLVSRLIIVCAVLRGGLRYIEQLSGHYVAFKLLAQIRSLVFEKLRKLAPAKLDGREKGDLISLITSDIEQIEVFYAHTIAPIAIAIIVSFLCCISIAVINPILAVIALIAYLTVGAIIPILGSKVGRKSGVEFRSGLGQLNSYFLESLRGVRETLQFQQVEKRKEDIIQSTKKLNQMQQLKAKHEGVVGACSGAAMIVFTYLILVVGIMLEVSFVGVVLSMAILFASFGPVLALSELSGMMTMTLASGERVLKLLEEKPQTEEVLDGELPDFKGAKVENISFGYKQENILENITIDVPKNNIIAINGKSGSGKSTLLKLLMRFWEAEEGEITISETGISEISTAHLRKLQAYMTQDVELFQGSIAYNISIGRLGASKKEIEEAAKFASIHSFIMSLPNGYETQVTELGENLSSGERQRIGLARAFLSNAPLILLDEPTSNLDALNEGIILKALKEKRDCTMIIVSHRKSTMKIADISYNIESVRAS